VDIAWDPNKAESNLRDHGVSFVEAATVLTDDYALNREGARHLQNHFCLEGQQAAKEAV
jgi:uncharacterized DUF497 family protein